MKKVLEFVKKETVLSIAAVLALISMLAVRPDKAYIGYIDFKTLSVLFCLMSVMAGLQEIGVFRYAAASMLKRVNGIRALRFTLVMLCFFFSMLITNDVALITFVPFTITVLKLCDRQNELVPITVMQTIAANLGSMLTPIGNPQNLYLYGKAEIGAAAFMGIMLPYAIAAFVMLALWCVTGKKQSGAELKVELNGNDKIENKRLAIMYALLFVVCALTVGGQIPYIWALIIVVLAVLSCDRKIFKKVDYSLLLTFVALFVFIGNMGRVEWFKGFIQGIIGGHEMLTALAASQVISNVPAALLLSGFTENTRALIVGTNIGGLGTLIASMASLISFKLVTREQKSIRGRYMLYFTIANVVFLLVLTPMYYIFG